MASGSDLQGIDYFIGRRLPEMLSGHGLADVATAAETAIYNGGSQWLRYSRLTITELRTILLDSGQLDDRSIRVRSGMRWKPPASQAVNGDRRRPK